MTTIAPPPELADFRAFLCLVWRSIGLPDPSPVQYQIADIIQNVLKNAGVVPLPPDPNFTKRYPMLVGEDGKVTRRIIIQAYRGFGKSWICATASCWILLWDQSKNILAVSAAKTKSDEFTTFCLQLIRDLDALKHLFPDKSLGDRCSALNFDVRGHPVSQAPSVRSCGVFGQLTGGRGDVIFPDDIEVPKTSETQTLREKLDKRSAELGGAVLKPGGCVIALGTPQCEETVYTKMRTERKYATVIFPARVPSDKWIAAHGSMLAPHVHKMLRRLGPACQTGGGLDGTRGIPTDPERFDEWELQDREAEYGRSGFDLQFMLDTSFSDRDRFPLRLRDLIVMDVPKGRAPDDVEWASAEDLVWKDLPNVGFRGDRYYRPLNVSQEWIPFIGTVMYIDPAGMGKDELGYAIVKAAGAKLYVAECHGLRGGYGHENLVHLANRAKLHGVNEIVTEPNFGDGMFDQLLAPVLRDIYPCTITPDEKATIQKEKRIIDVLEPVMNQHLLVVSPEVIRGDLIPHEGEGAEHAQARSLFFQMTRITREKRCLKHDDRLDALAGAVAYWMKSLGADVQAQREERRIEALQAAALEFEKRAITPVEAPAPNLWFNAGWHN